MKGGEQPLSPLFKFKFERGKEEFKKYLEFKKRKRKEQGDASSVKSFNYTSPRT